MYVWINKICNFAHQILIYAYFNTQIHVWNKRIKTALVSVYHKEGLDEIITKLHEEGVEFLSTGGTRQFIESLGYPCKAVEDLTTYPSILGGRVKTLHPKVFGGILCRRGLEQDMQQIENMKSPK